jgi:hypothetical protein
MGCSVEDTLVPLVRYLEEELGLGKDGASKLVKVFPDVLGLSVNDDIVPTVRYLEDELGLGRAV